MAAHCLGNPFPPIHHFIRLEVIVAGTVAGIADRNRVTMGTSRVYYQSVMRRLRCDRHEIAT